MTRTLWSGGRPVDADVSAFTVGEDREWDRRLLVWDILGTAAHVDGLAAVGVLDGEERGQLRTALRDALAAVDRGDFTVSDDDEDVHTALEAWLVARLGQLGEKVHTGRSRNDQVIVDLRLYMKDALLEVMDRTLDASAALLAFARRHQKVLLPGYTHQRRAMPSTLALWAGGLAEALLDDLGPIEAVLDLADRSPLGSAAGYGVPLPLDRELVAQRLGFAAVQRNVTTVQASRGKLEATVLAALWPVGFDLAKLAWDVILWSSEEYGFLVLPSELATGSSIMPHKRNPDPFELIRGRAGLLEGLVVEVMAVAGRLPSGYHRDLQLTKGPLMRGLEIVEEMLAMVASAVPRLGVDRDVCRAAVTGDLLATDEVFRRVRTGVPFRAAYSEVADEVRRGAPVPSLGAEEILAARTSTGGAGSPGLAAAGVDLRRWRRRVSRRRSAFSEALERLLGDREEGST